MRWWVLCCALFLVCQVCTSAQRVDSHDATNIYYTDGLGSIPLSEGPGIVVTESLEATNKLVYNFKTQPVILVPSAHLVAAQVAWIVEHKLRENRPTVLWLSVPDSYVGTTASFCDGNSGKVDVQCFQGNNVESYNSILGGRISYCISCPSVSSISFWRRVSEFRAGVRFMSHIMQDTSMLQEVFQEYFNSLLKKSVTTYDSSYFKSLHNEKVVTKVAPHPNAATNIFDLRSVVSRLAKKNQIIIAESNRGFHDMTMNWVHYVKELGVTNYLVFALDAAEYELLLGEGVNAYFDPTSLLDGVTEHAQNYNLDQYFHVVAQKHVFVSQILEMGINVLLSDVDIVLLTNPFEYIENTQPHCDFYLQCDNWEANLIQSNGRYKVTNNNGGHYCISNNMLTPNTGFMYLRSNQRTVNMVKLLISLCEQHMTEGNDQQIFTLWMNTMAQKPGFAMHDQVGQCIQLEEVSFQFFDPVLFSNGISYWKFQLSQKVGVIPAMIHFNWLVGKDTKIAKMKELGFWLGKIPRTPGLLQLQ